MSGRDGNSIDDFNDSGEDSCRERMFEDDSFHGPHFREGRQRFDDERRERFGFGPSTDFRDGRFGDDPSHHDSQFPGDLFQHGKQDGGRQDGGKQRESKQDNGKQGNGKPENGKPADGKQSDSKHPGEKSIVKPSPPLHSAPPPTGKQLAPRDPGDNYDSGYYVEGEKFGDYHRRSYSYSLYRPEEYSQETSSKASQRQPANVPSGSNNAGLTGAMSSIMGGAGVMNAIPGANGQNSQSSANNGLNGVFGAPNTNAPARGNAAPPTNGNAAPPANRNALLTGGNATPLANGNAAPLANQNPNGRAATQGFAPGLFPKELISVTKTVTKTATVTATTTKTDTKTATVTATETDTVTATPTYSHGSYVVHKAHGAKQ